MEVPHQPIGDAVIIQWWNGFFRPRTLGHEVLTHPAFTTIRRGPSRYARGDGPLHREDWTLSGLATSEAMSSSIATRSPDERS